MARRTNELDEDFDRDIEVEVLAMQMSDLIGEVMRRENVTRAELARRLNVSRAHVTQMLSGEQNLTLRSMAESLYALGHRVEASAVGLESRRDVPS